jgi:L-lactate permease
MGLKDAGKRVATRLIVGAFVREHMDKIKAAVVWLNAEPGRKRGIGCVLFMIAAGLRYLNHLEAAQAFETIEHIVQQITVDTEVTALLISLIGLLHAKKRSDEKKAAA